MRELGKVMVLIMQKYLNEDATGIEDLERWGLSSNAVDFVSVTTSVSSVNELAKVSRSPLSSSGMKG